MPLFTAVKALLAKQPQRTSSHAASPSCIAAQDRSSGKLVENRHQLMKRSHLYRNHHTCTIPSANPVAADPVSPKPLCANPLVALKSATNPYNLAHGSGVATSKTMQTSN
jgi:hypothetical protein